MSATEWTWCRSVIAIGAPNHMEIESLDEPTRGLAAAATLQALDSSEQSWILRIAALGLLIDPPSARFLGWVSFVTKAEYTLRGEQFVKNFDRDLQEPIAATPYHGPLVRVWINTAWVHRLEDLCDGRAA
ncbi:MAG: hypothetical protein Q8Q09_25660 [Deltaproteobacteria bacterium]|nr:hypothetical protein [Deltaproteobacteria bacterium]